MPGREGLDQRTTAETWSQEQKSAYQTAQVQPVRGEIVADRLSTKEKLERKRQVKSVIRRLQML